MTGTVIFTAFLVVVLAIAVQGAFATRASIAVTFQREADMQRARVDLQQMMRLQTDEESFLRGFVLTGDQFYVQQYASASEQWTAKEAAVRSALATEHMTFAARLLATYARVQADWRREIAQRIVAVPGSDLLTLDTKSKSYVDYEDRVAQGVDAAIVQTSTRLERSTQDQINRSSYERAFWVLIFGLLAVFFNGYLWQLTRQLDEERTIAGVLQQAFRSKSVPLPNCDVGTVYLSASGRLRVGGDVYDVFRLDADRALVMIGDVSGKGTEAAVITAFVRFTVRMFAQQNAGPAAILAEFNKTFARTVDNASLFITMLVGVLDCSTGTFAYASGGHDSAYLRRSGSVEPLLVTGPLLGVMDAAYAEKTIELERDDALVLATDGLTETRSKSGELLGERGAMEWIAAAPAAAQELAEDLRAHVRARTKNRPADDLALLVVRYLGKNHA
ncbi:MAG: PP2C family protein-serine/threonine phosphatase [Candidatus Tyrphobacter sp.]